MTSSYVGVAILVRVVLDKLVIATRTGSSVGVAALLGWQCWDVRGHWTSWPVIYMTGSKWH